MRRSIQTSLAGAVFSLFIFNCSAQATTLQECEQINFDSYKAEYERDFGDSSSDDTDKATILRRMYEKKLRCLGLAEETVNTQLAQAQTALAADNTDANKKKVEELQQQKSDILEKFDLTVQQRSNTTSLQLAKEDKKLRQLSDTDPTLSIINIGAQLSPKYDENGENSGFDEKSFYGTLAVNTRWVKDEVTFLPDWLSWLNPNGLGFTAYLDFRSLPVVDCNPDDVSAQGDVCENSDEENYIPSSFNDINDSLTAGLTLIPYLYDDKDSEYSIGLPIRYGFNTRETVGPDGDSTNSFWGLGLRFEINDWKKFPGAKNGLPRFYLDISKVQYEDGFNSIKELEGKFRTVVDAAVRMGDTPMYIGLRHDGGKGPDYTALTISYVFDGEKLVDLF